MPAPAADQRLGNHAAIPRRGEFLLGDQRGRGHRLPRRLWDGADINSSLATTEATYGVPYITGLGVIDNNFNGSAVYTSFLGRSMTQNSVLVRYTLYGDANLDGALDSSDYSLIDSAYAAIQGMQAQPINWLNGDFNYDGTIDGADYALIDTAFAFPPRRRGRADGAAARGGVRLGLHKRSRGARGRQRSHQRAGAGRFGLLLFGGAMLGLRRRRTRNEMSSVVSLPDGIGSSIQ